MRFMKNEVCSLFAAYVEKQTNKHVQVNNFVISFTEDTPIMPYAYLQQ
jgi:hypothetical protein